MQTNNTKSSYSIPFKHHFWKGLDLTATWQAPVQSKIWSKINFMIRKYQQLPLKQTCNQNSINPVNNHILESQPKVLVLWNILKLHEHCTLAWDGRILLNPNRWVVISFARGRSWRCVVWRLCVWFPYCGNNPVPG